jgi:8-hydroxy-5-deazaflavin:NADPH oxidoreductase
MNIAVLGTGVVGQALAARLSGLGHRVFMGTRNVADSLAKMEADRMGNPSIGTWLKEHPEVRLKAFQKAVEEGGELVVFAMNGQVALECLQAVGEQLLNGKVLIDISNPLDFSKGFPPLLSVCNTESLGEQIQNQYPSLKVVKTLNTMSNPIMVNPTLIEGDHSVFVSGNDQDAKAKVTEMLKSFGWEDSNIIDLGDITTARGTEMILPLWLRLYSKFQTPLFNFSINKAKQ